MKLTIDGAYASRELLQSCIATKIDQLRRKNLKETNKDIKLITQNDMKALQTMSDNIQEVKS